MRNAIAILGLSAIFLSAFAQAAGVKQRAPAPKDADRVTFECSWPRSPDSEFFSEERSDGDLASPPAIVSHYIPAGHYTIEVCQQSCGDWQIDRDEYRRRTAWSNNKGYETVVINRSTGSITLTRVATATGSGEEVPVSVQGNCRLVHR